MSPADPPGPPGPWATRPAIARDQLIGDTEGEPCAILVDDGYSSSGESDSSSGSSQDSWCAPARDVAQPNHFLTSLIFNRKSCVVHKLGTAGRSDCGNLRWSGGGPRPDHIVLVASTPYQAVKCSRCFA